MHTFYTRINNIFFFGVTALFLLSAGAALTTAAPRGSPLAPGWALPPHSPERRTAVDTLAAAALEQFKPQAPDARSGRVGKLDRVVRRASSCARREISPRSFFLESARRLARVDGKQQQMQLPVPHTSSSSSSLLLCPPPPPPHPISC